MAVFIGQHENKIDRKGRVSVPSKFRAQLAEETFQGVVVYPSPKFTALEGCSFKRIEQVAASLDDLDMLSDNADDLAATILAEARELPFDSEGRIMLPKELLDEAGIDSAVLFVGQGKTFQIWAPEAYKRRKEEARERIRSGEVTLKLRRDNGAGGDGA
ncbi:division/cell wall cluster transcriptional repressor MraZ [Oceanibaculum pacificum]|uniref:Transcriptional regulator MraZ n=1 Tax=Oceanibaculum pacificum TaxID=580166 RepID=A0A154W0G1_9PROT|nr:division/cell wall cluster transcriptional repressor MraZ [Oceanibaculum pacificum]KZD06998.1 cell division protein MraZ [Oceanibaculum pacificum]